ncbi:MAG: hypothetical protein KatS3mg018_1455 [Fimbriimonadales bacterium]|nr:MAG: hypothetical protein KatS3mg018_1455 [Fimbriimonadales bacterium]
MKNECEHWEPLLHEWLEDWLAESEHAAVEAHLKACPACCAKVAGWQAVGRALRELPRVAAPARRSPHTAPEPRGALRLALALCLPTALLVVAFRTSFSPPLTPVSPDAVAQTIARPFTAPVQTLWNRLQEVISSWTAS